jgi:hypothetical protein
MPRLQISWKKLTTNLTLEQLLFFRQNFQSSHTPGIAKNLIENDLVPGKFNHIERVIEIAGNDVNRMFLEVAKAVQGLNNPNLKDTVQLFDDMRSCLQEAMDGRMADYLHRAKDIKGSDIFANIGLHIERRQWNFEEILDLNATERHPKNLQDGNTAWGKATIDRTVDEYHELDDAERYGKAKSHRKVIRTLQDALDRLTPGSEH